MFSYIKDTSVNIDGLKKNPQKTKLLLGDLCASHFIKQLQLNQTVDSFFDLNDSQSKVDL